MGPLWLAGWHWSTHGHAWYWFTGKTVLSLLHDWIQIPVKSWEKFWSIGGLRGSAWDYPCAICLYLRCPWSLSSKQSAFYTGREEVTCFQPALCACFVSYCLLCFYPYTVMSASVASRYPATLPWRWHLWWGDWWKEDVWLGGKGQQSEVQLWPGHSHGGKR